MPTESLLVAVCVVAMFVVFGAVLIWGDMQTRPKQSARIPRINAARSDIGRSPGRDRLQEGVLADEQARRSP